MSIPHNIKSALNDDLKTFKWFERAIATICISIPVVLLWTDKDSAGVYTHHFRSSISQYVYMYHSYVFGMMLTIAAMMFIFNGALYFKNDDKKELELSKAGKWYNVILGLSLLGVVSFPCEQFAVAHYTFAIIFFVGNAIVTWQFHKVKHRVVSDIMAAITVIALVFGIFSEHLIPSFTLLWGEWVSLTVIAIHFILQAE